jgi:hypothetical protein
VRTEASRGQHNSFVFARSAFIRRSPRASPDLRGLRGLNRSTPKMVCVEFLRTTGRVGSFRFSSPITSETSSDSAPRWPSALRTLSKSPPMNYSALPRSRAMATSQPQDHSPPREDRHPPSTTGRTLKTIDTFLRGATKLRLQGKAAAIRATKKYRTSNRLLPRHDQHQRRSQYCRRYIERSAAALMGPHLRTDRTRTRGSCLPDSRLQDRTQRIVSSLVVATSLLPMGGVSTYLVRSSLRLIQAGHIAFRRQVAQTTGSQDQRQPRSVRELRTRHMDLMLRSVGVIAQGTERLAEKRRFLPLDHSGRFERRVSMSPERPWRSLVFPG